MDQTEERLQQLQSVTEAPKSAKDIIPLAKEIEKDLMELPEVELAGPLVKRAINLLVAQSGSGKSLVAYCISWKETKEGNFPFTMYLNFDDPPNDYIDRFSHFEKLPNFLYIVKTRFKKWFGFLGGDTPGEIGWEILKSLATDPPDESGLIVIDNLQKMCDYNDLKELKRFFNLCDQLTEKGFTMLIIHHKSSKSEAPSFKGLSYIYDSADVVWEVKPERTKSGKISNIRLTSSKSRSLTGFTEFIISFSTDQGIVNYNQNVLLEDEIPVKEAIIEYLAQHPNSNQSDIVQNIKPKVTIGILRTRAVLEKMVGLHILEVQRGGRNAKLYKLSETLEPGYLDGLEDEQDATLDALPF